MGRQSVLRDDHRAGQTGGGRPLLNGRRGDGDQAAGYHRRSPALYRELGDRGGEACAHNGLGEAFFAGGRFAEARAEHTEALGIAEDPAVGDRSEQARAHTGVAAAYRRLGAVAGVREHYLVAQALWTKLGSPRADEVAQAMAAIGP